MVSVTLNVAWPWALVMAEPDAVGLMWECPAIRKGDLLACQWLRGSPLVVQGDGHRELAEAPARGRWSGSR